jgi:hypothetical protein
MKIFLSIFLFILFAINGVSQEKPIFNFGVGIPFLYEKGNYSYSGGEIYFGSDRINLFVETPALIGFKRNPDFYISPGFSFLSLSESESGGALGGSGGKNYKRSALSIYTKFLYEPEIKFIKQNVWNFGLITGYYLYTKAKGTYNWGYMGGQQWYYGSEEIDSDSKPFFKSFYFGFNTCFQLNFEKAKFLKPAIEFSFYPEYANIFDSYSGDSGKDISHNMFMGSIILGLGSKKSTQ